MEQRKIGRNFTVKCFGKTHVLGGQDSLFLFISMHIALIAIFIGWILSNNYYHHYATYIIGFILYCLAAYNGLCCFFTEPGIIPREHPDYQLKADAEPDKDSKGKDSSPLIQTDTSAAAGTEPIIPSIFTERHCSTCKILRPPKASHCDNCGNCVLNFDHHCYFISNCVGARNHKYFLLVLFFGTLFSLYITCFSISHAIYVFITYKDPNILSLLFKEHLALMIVSSILVGITFCFLCMGCSEYLLACVPASIGYVIVIVLFYISIGKQPREYPYLYNPFSVIIVGAGIGLGAFGGANLGKVIYNVFKGYTTKQLVSIRRESDKSNAAREEIEEGYLKPRTCKEKMSNLLELACRKQIPSLIEPSRDLEFHTVLI